ncbi:hypothetical protein KFK09_013126 [Dendrobium nobile]|uniref:Uncharacterized protein n=1 Tax=Dendrobium nobile TaxID=94219 RepID=A0A8T3B841_DENNO|nr:hypothetical protein KFK09_013126 [Dendrobium nobile]
MDIKCFNNQAQFQTLNVINLRGQSLKHLCNRLVVVEIIIIASLERLLGTSHQILAHCLRSQRVYLLLLFLNQSTQLPDVLYESELNQNSISRKVRSRMGFPKKIRNKIVLKSLHQTNYIRVAEKPLMYDARNNI